MEVKAAFGRRQTPSAVHDLAKIRQTRNGARLVHHLLASRGVKLAVREVLVLAGPGSPRTEGLDLRDAVLVVASPTALPGGAC